jgi:molybdenum cofactor biosynthesis protein MoaC
MRDVSEKITTLRTATAETKVTMRAETLARLRLNDVPKQDVLAIARAAAVMAAKKTPELIPYCHGVPLDCVTVDMECADGAVFIRASATAIWKTGVEMEALVAASTAALTVYDMLKPIDKDMEIGALKLVEKTGGKSDFVETLSRGFKAAVIVTSDGTYAGTREDKSGRIIKERLERLGVAEIEYAVLPDEAETIRAKILDYCGLGADLVITTGGTGLGPRDVTVEATRKVIEREMPAVMETIRSYGQARTPYAMLSRGLAGVRGKTVILNLPGSSRGVREGLNAAFPALLHVFKMMKGGGH